MAYLGKISAVISANTTDFTRAIGNAKSELEGLRRRVDGYRLNLDTAALDKTLTKLQLFRRTLQEALGKGIDTGPLQDLYRAYEDLGKPLTKVKGQIESLSYATQAQLYPALERVQKGFQNLYRDIQSGSTTFDAQRGRIESLTRSLERLKASTAVVSEFSRATASLSTESAGATFVQPRAIEQLKRAAAIRNDAAKLQPATREDPFFQSMILGAEVAAERIEFLAARVERAKLRAAAAEAIISRDTSSGKTPPAVVLASAASAAADQARYQTALDRQTESLRLQNDRMQGATTLSALSSLRQGPSSSREAQSAEAVARAVAELRASNPGGAFEPLVQNLLDTAEAASRATGSAKQLSMILDDLDAKAAAGSRLGAAQTQLNKIDSDAKASVASLKTREDRRREATKEARDAGVSKDDITGARRRDFLANEIGGRVQSLQSGISGLSGSLGRDLQQRLDAARGSLTQLVNTKATPLQSEVNRLRALVSGLEGDFERAAAQSKLLADFDASTAMNLQPRAIKDYTNDFQLLLNLAGNLNEEMGTTFGTSLQASKSRVRALAEEIARIKLEPATPAAARQVEALLQQIRRESRSLAAELVALDPSRFSAKQLDRLLSANRRLQGDIAGMRGAAMQGQLALQQLTFAVDDFFSSTGGFEYKLRAISNNISQFAFILGGTKGLIAGVAATVGAQLLLQFSGMGKESKQAEAALKFMNEELEKSRNLAEQTAKAFDEMAKAIRGAASGGQRGDIEQRVREIREEQKKAREADVRSRSPDVAKAAGERATLEEQASKARGTERVRLLREAEDARRRERAASARSMTPIDGESPSGPLVGVRDLLERARQIELFSLSRREFRPTVPFGEQKRADRLETLRAERVTAPQSQAEAIKQIKERLAELAETQSTADPLIRFAANLSDSMGLERGGAAAAVVSGLAMPGRASDVLAFRDTERLADELDAELARLEAIVRKGADDLVASFAEQALAAKDELAGVVRSLASLQVDADISANLAAQLEGPAASLGDAVKKIEEALKDDPNADISALKQKATDAAKALESLYQKADQMASDVALGKLIPTATKLGAAQEMAGGVGGPTLAGSNAARYADDLRKATAIRDRAQLRGDSAAVAEADKQIERIRNLSDELQAAAIAVAAFQRAAEEAALGLSRTLADEARSDANRMRRRANRLAGDPMMAGSAAAERDAAEKRRRDEEDSARKLEADMARARLEFEKTGEGARLAREIREGRATAANLTLPVADQMAGKERADRAQAELDRQVERSAAAQKARQDADARDAARQAEVERIRRSNERTVSGMSMSQDILGDNARLATGIGAGAVRQSTELAAQMEEAKKKVEEAASAGVEIPKALKDELDRLAGEIAAQRKRFVDQAVANAKNEGSGYTAQGGRARGELERAGVFASDIQGQLTEMAVRREALVAEREAAKKENRADDAAAVQKDIDAMDAHAEALNKAAIAVAAFQAAANRAALDLQSKVTSESQSAAESARRRANEAEAVFGAGSPQAKEARAEQRRREESARAAEDERARADAAIAGERAKFEREMAEGKNPAAKARADEIAQLEKDAADQRKTAGEREAARARADELRRQQEREFENRPEVQGERRRADEADARRARADSAERGRDLMKSDIQKAREEIASKAGDLGNAVADMRREGAGRRQIQDAVQAGANRMGREQAPLFAQFADEVMNARLAGPSRAALNATDVQTTEGARELNRLLRGDDASKDVNLTELKKQSQLLEAIETAIRNSTGVVVDL